MRYESGHNLNLKLEDFNKEMPIEGVWCHYVLDTIRYHYAIINFRQQHGPMISRIQLVML